MIEKTIETMPGVDSETDEPSEVRVTLPDGSTCIELNFTDEHGGSVTVYLNYRQTTALVMHLANVVSHL